VPLPAGELSSQSLRGLSPAEAPDMSRPRTEPMKPGKVMNAREMAEAPHAYSADTEPVKPGKVVDAREMAEMPEPVEPGETV